MIGLETYTAFNIWSREISTPNFILVYNDTDANAITVWSVGGANYDRVSIFDSNTNSSNDTPTFETFMSDYPQAIAVTQPLNGWISFPNDDYENFKNFVKKAPCIHKIFYTLTSPGCPWYLTTFLGDDYTIQISATGANATFESISFLTDFPYAIELPGSIW